MARERGIDAARHEQLRKAHGLDPPVSVQYGISIGRVLRGDLGKSMSRRNRSCRRSRRCDRPAFLSMQAAPHGHLVIGPVRELLHQPARDIPESKT